MNCKRYKPFSNIYSKATIILLLPILLLGCNSFNKSEEQPTIKVAQQVVFQRNIETTTFEASVNSENTLSQYYSFDSHTRNSQDFKKNDICFTADGNTNISLVFKSLSLAQSLYVENNDPSGIITFDRKECISDDYSTGSRPIPKINSKYCWKTNDGNLVEFVVTDISQIIDDQITYQVTIKYIIWDK